MHLYPEIYRMHTDRITILWEQYLSGRMSREERKELKMLSQDPGLSAHLESLVSASVDNYIHTSETYADKPAQLERLRKAIQPVRRIYRWGWAAAAIALLIGTAFYFRDAILPHTAHPATADVAPGREGAILTLADGSQVVLDSLGNGLVAHQHGAQIVIQNGQLAYRATGVAMGRMAYNKITTPKGRQFHLQLPDGSKVWLNAASSLRYPTAFAANERRVEVTGEAYFEIAQNARAPFRVSINNKADVDVLGTSFNINAYENEAGINTTLVDGSIRISSAGSVIIKPGQQAQVVSGRVRLTGRVDTEKVIAWKNGLFNFEDATLDEVMRQLERWYDIDVVYENGVPDIQLMGKITRDVSLSGLLTGLANLGLHYRLEGRKLIVLPE